MAAPVETPMTAAEFFQLPETSLPVELLDGEVLMSPAPELGHQDSVLQTRCWMVERAFGWLSHYWVLSKDDTVLPRNSEAVAYVAMTHLMVRRLACEPATAPQ